MRSTYGILWNVTELPHFTLVTKYQKTNSKGMPSNNFFWIDTRCNLSRQPSVHVLLERSGKLSRFSYKISLWYSCLNQVLGKLFSGPNITFVSWIFGTYHLFQVAVVLWNTDLTNSVSSPRFRSRNIKASVRKTLLSAFQWSKSLFQSKLKSRTKVFIWNWNGTPRRGLERVERACELDPWQQWASAILPIPRTF